MSGGDAVRKGPRPGLDPHGHFLGALLLAFIGISALVSGLEMFWYYSNAQNDVDRQAAEQGVGTIPGVGFENEVALSKILIGVGAVVIACAFAVGFRGALMKRSSSGP